MEGLQRVRRSETVGDRGHFDGFVFAAPGSKDKASGGNSEEKKEVMRRGWTMDGETKMDKG